jgi:hypothetical protein
MSFAAFYAVVLDLRVNALACRSEISSLVLWIRSSQRWYTDQVLIMYILDRSISQNQKGS